MFLTPCTKAALQTVQCAALIAPYVFRQSAGAVLLSAMPRYQGNKRDDLRPDSFYVPVLYRRTFVWRCLIVC
ncbi:uncharacterized protein Asalp_28170 [Aeromonas salmonicida subsp. pectinolytica 34mel]|uniref:Uncharacterized protein n=1 Tax=Aeromonas salmonicida subsp. pectinolytica 34mel TaxID=1324960 RepID=A0A2D1QHS2_AERSA|nr:uncharacterized protein Asalp_28170 [Aeromonas salmonicida subsp. pectinolytica 34mel]